MRHSLARLQTVLTQAEELRAGIQQDVLPDFNVEGNFGVTRICRLLSRSYRKLEKWVDEQEREEQFRLIHLSRKKPEALASVNQLRMLSGYVRKNLRTHLVAYLVHGSMADGQFTPYSDIDTLAIIRKRTCLSSTRLQKAIFHLHTCNRYLFSYDITQHHGQMIGTEIDLLNHRDSFYPHVLFDISRPLFARQFSIRVRQANLFADRLAIFLNLLQFFRHLYAKNVWPITSSYELKRVLSRLMLLPALYYAVTGEPTDKKSALIRLQKDLSSDLVLPIRKASLVRKYWPKSRYPLVESVMLKTRYPFVLASLFRGTKKIPPVFLRMLGNEFPNECLGLVEYLYDEIGVRAKRFQDLDQG